MTEEQKSKSTDHDTLIRIETLVQALGEKMDALANNTGSQFVEHEKRIRAIEDRVLRVQIESHIERYDRVSDWVESFQSRIAVYATIAGLVTALLTSLLSHLIRNFIRF